MSREIHRWAFWKRKQDAGALSDIERDCILRVYLNDTRCELFVLNKTGEPLDRLERTVSDDPLDTKSPLLATIELLTPELERRIGDVEVFLDDESISVVDSRQAKLSHFEGRSLAEFGKYQLGGKPVCFASHRFGETSAQETEKRIVAYIAEDKLTSVLFALGKLARFTTFFGPWSLQQFFHETCDETRAQLAVHGNYSTLTLANGSAGAVAVRHLPVGTQTFARAYADVHGIARHEAKEALGTRIRLALGKAFPLPAASPLAAVGTYQALAPALERLSGEITNTTDYFEFQRLAGRASTLQLSMLGSKIAGFANWLGDILHIDVADEKAECGVAPSPVLNLLEGMRTGLLKIGNQHFDFIGGHFVPSANMPAGSIPQEGVAAKWKSASSQPVTLETLKPFALPAAAIGAFAVLLVAGYTFLIAPIDQQSATSADLYASMLSRVGQVRTSAAQPTSDPVLWARDMLSIGAAMPYDMKLKRLALVAGPASVGTTLEVSGVLPKDGTDNLQLIGRFITKLTSAPALRRRLSDVTFAGTGASDSKDSDETIFKVVGKVAGGTAP